MILDSLSTLVRSGVENEAESWAPIQDWLLTHRWQGRTIILVHHEGKGGKPRGSSKRRVYRRKNELLKLHLTALAKDGGTIDKDLFLYLRPLKLAETIRFRSLFEKRLPLISFEEALSRAVDKLPQRYAFCVGDGDERWGVAQVSFENELWTKRIVPLFKNVSAIISMPGETNGCLNESHLIRSTNELCNRTIFVIPPLNCYNPRIWKTKLDIKDYYNQVIKRHKQEVGLHFPDAQMDVGVFLVMDPHTGKPVKQLEWQQLSVKNFDGNKFQGIETTPVLTAERIKAAIAMVA